MKKEDTSNGPEDSDEKDMNALRMLFKHKYVQAEPEVAGIENSRATRREKRVLDAWSKPI